MSRESLNIPESRLLIKQILIKSLDLEKGDLIVVEGIDVAPDFIELFVAEANLLDVRCYVFHKSSFQLINNNNLEELSFIKASAQFELQILKKAKALIGFRHPNDLYTFKQLRSDARRNVLSYYVRPVHFEFRNARLQWIYVRLPSKVYATDFDSLEKFKEYYLRSMLIPYHTFKDQLAVLKEIFRSCDQVKIKGASTDLTFSIAGQDVYRSCGNHNLPDGEIFTSPIRTSMNGYITFNVPSVYYGVRFDAVFLRFKDGRVSEWDSGSQTAELEKILKQDSGSSFVGEFALGLNPFVNKPIGDILFDEKMEGTIHLALGNSYPEADNGNRSSIHWDLILDQRQNSDEHLYFDNVLIRKGGVFVDKRLKNLNVEPLKKVLSYG